MDGPATSGGDAARDSRSDDAPGLGLRARASQWNLAPGGRRSFRIEAADGTLLRIVRDARHEQEAIALYWRGAGVELAGSMSQDLDRRVRLARTVEPAAPELPLELPPESADELEATQAEAASRGGTRSGRVSRGTAGNPAQTDLFGRAAAAAASVDTAPGEPPAHAAAAEPEALKAAAAENEAPPASETFSDEHSEEAPPPEAPPEDAIPEPYWIGADSVMLQRVDARNLRPTDPPDSYLYHITNATDAAVALRHGLAVSASDPVILTERRGVAYWLSVLAEDYDYILDGPPNFVVLRMRRIAVEALLDPDPHASRSAGCACFLLTGGGHPAGE